MQCPSCIAETKFSRHQSIKSGGSKSITLGNKTEKVGQYLKLLKFLGTAILKKDIPTNNKSPM